MKKTISLLVMSSFLSNAAMADCDWTKIKKNSDNTYTYSENLHLCVGRLVEDNKNLTAQNQDLKKAIDLKDLAIKYSDDRTQLWMKTSDQLMTRVNSIDSTYKRNEFLYFGLGVLATIGASFAAAKLIGR